MEISNEDLTAIIRTAVEGAAVDRIVKEAKTNIDSTIYPGGLSPADVEVRLADLEARSTTGGGGVTVSKTPFWLDGDTVRNCKVYFGRKLLTCEDTRVTVTANRCIYVEFLHSTSDSSYGNGPNILIQSDSGQTPPAPSAFRSYFLLYTIDNDGEVVDHRSTPVLEAFYN